VTRKGHQEEGEKAKAEVRADRDRRAGGRDLEVGPRAIERDARILWEWGRRRGNARAFEPLSQREIERIGRPLDGFSIEAGSVDHRPAHPFGELLATLPGEDDLASFVEEEIGGSQQKGIDVATILPLARDLDGPVASELRTRTPQGNQERSSPTHDEPGARIDANAVGPGAHHESDDEGEQAEGAENAEALCAERFRIADRRRDDRASDRCEDGPDDHAVTRRTGRPGDLLRR
jgi:hypothetical protein